ncbi:hypothetical protein J6S88_05355 [bacterium]|nr:hypothetical protein [bacterium]
MVRINGNYDYQTANVGAGNTVFTAGGAPEVQQNVPIGQSGNSGGTDRQARIVANQERKAQLEAELARLEASLPPEPERPVLDGTMITVTTNVNSTLSGLANEYFCTEADIKAQNPSLNKHELWVNTEYVIPTVSEEKRNAYNQAVAERTRINNEIYELRSQIYELDNAIKIDQNIVMAEGIIGKICSSRKSERFDENYSISIDYTTGNIKLTFKEERYLSDVKSDFGLADGVIRNANGEDKLETFGKRHWLFYKNYDDRYGSPGETLIIPPGACSKWLED